MKRTIIFSLSLLSLFGLAKAQQPAMTFSNQIPSYIPQIYSASNEIQLPVFTFDDELSEITMQIYNAALEPVGNPVAVPQKNYDHIYTSTTYYYDNATNSWVQENSWDDNEYGQSLIPIICGSANIGGNGVSDPTLFGCTQTLFNTDADFEYIMPRLSTMTDTEYCRDCHYDYNTGAQSDERTIRTRTRCTGLEITKDGNIPINVINFPAGYYMADLGDDIFGVLIVRIGNYTYLVCPTERRVYDEEESWHETDILTYRINAATQSIEQVDVNFPINVFPSPAKQDSYITVDLGENEANEIQLIDASGVVVKSVPVYPGQKEVQISTTGLSKGFGFVNAKGSKSNKAFKIVIK